MRYLALGDSISIDDYTGVAGGGAASQFARLIQADEFINRTMNGATTEDVLASLGHITAGPDMVTLTAGGNDFLMAMWSTPEDFRSVAVDQALARLRLASVRIATYRCPVIMNTVYDPTDGDDRLAAAAGVPPQFRAAYNDLNAGIGALARETGFLLADLEALFHGHGVESADPWFVQQIEPNLKGATAIAHEWHRLYVERPGRPSNSVDRRRQ